MSERRLIGPRRIGTATTRRREQGERNEKTGSQHKPLILVEVEPTVGFEPTIPFLGPDYKSGALDQLGYVGDSRISCTAGS